MTHNNKTSWKWHIDSRDPLQPMDVEIKNDPINNMCQLMYLKVLQCHDDKEKRFRSKTQYTKMISNEAKHKSGPDPSIKKAHMFGARIDDSSRKRAHDSSPLKPIKRRKKLKI